MRLDAGSTPLSAIHSTVRGNDVVIDGTNHMLLLSGGTRDGYDTRTEMRFRFSSSLSLFVRVERCRERVYCSSQRVRIDCDRSMLSSSHEKNV